MPSLRYDRIDDIGYIELTTRQQVGVDRTVEVVPGVLFDVDDDRVVGVEFIGLENLRNWLMAAVRMRDVTIHVSQR